MGETSLSTNEAFFLLLGLLIGISSMGGVLWYFLRERNRRIFELGEQVKLESQKNSEIMIEFQGLQSKHDAMLELIQGREQFTEKAIQNHIDFSIEFGAELLTSLASCWYRVGSHVD